MPTIGLRDVYYAKLTQDDSSGVAYEAPIRIAGAIQANINPNPQIETLFADDGPMETATTLGEIELELTAADVPIDIQADLLGHTISNGMLIRKSTDTPPWVAVGFKALKSNGSYRYVWLFKGKFMVPEMNHETKGEDINFQTQTISGRFVRRDYDDAWMKSTDTDYDGYVSSVGDNWFTSVEIGADSTAPTVSSTTPTDGATGVSVISSFVWTFSEAIQASCVTSANFFVVDADTGTNVSGTLAQSADKIQVTFTPSSNLSALTSYIAVATSNVKDLAGNKLAANHYTNFTTA